MRKLYSAEFLGVQGLCRYTIGVPCELFFVVVVSFGFLICLLDLQVSLQNSVTNTFLTPHGRTVSTRQ